MSGNKVEPLISPKDLELNANFLGSGNLDKICKILFLLNCKILIVHPSPHCLDKKVGSGCLVLSTLRNGAPSVQLNGPLTGPLLCLCYVVPAPRKDRVLGYQWVFCFQLCRSGSGRHPYISAQGTREFWSPKAGL